MSEILVSAQRSRKVPWFAVIAIGLVIALSAAIAVSLSTRGSNNAPVRDPGRTATAPAPDSCLAGIRGVC